MKKVRIDRLLVDQGLAESRSKAQRLLMAGQIRVDGEIVIKASRSVSSEASIVVDQGLPYVSRGGEKLVAALKKFNISPEGWVCADVGASTGGFTDCLLQQGAKRVYAVDVGKGVLHWKLRQDERVIIMEKTNARYLDDLPETVRLVTVDVSFISLKLILPVVYNWTLSGEGMAVTLIKPQFEAGRIEVSKAAGVIRDPKIHRKVLTEILNFSQKIDFGVEGLIRSPLLGAKGNTEFLALLTKSGPKCNDIRDMVRKVNDLSQ